MAQSFKNLVQLNCDWSVIAERLERNPQSAHAVFAECNVDAESLFPLCNTASPGEPYGRRVLYKSDRYEVMLATWVKGAECAPHNHGFSRGLVWLVSGIFIENHYSFENDLRQIDSCLHSEASALVSVDTPDIHSMRAPQGGISLHVYYPPIHAMKVYDLNSRRILTVSDECGAWVPRDSKLIVDVKTWPNPHALSI